MKKRLRKKHRKLNAAQIAAIRVHFAKLGIKYVGSYAPETIMSARVQLSMKHLGKEK